MRPVIEMRDWGDGERYTELSVVVGNRLVCARVGLAPGDERYVALLLHELAARGAIDVRVVRHWFELCEKGDGPPVEGKKR